MWRSILFNPQIFEHDRSNEIMTKMCGLGFIIVEMFLSQGGCSTIMTIIILFFSMKHYLLKYLDTKAHKI